MSTRRAAENNAAHRCAVTRAIEASLEPHPALPFAPSTRVRALAQRTPEGDLALRYVIEAPPGALRVPARAIAPERTDGLWRHTCFEAFVTRVPGGAYHEINLSPSGDWAIYAFRSYREPSPPARAGAAPLVTTVATADRLELSADIRLAELDGSYDAVPVFAGVCAVIEAADGSLSYFAHCHPARRPDFHHAHGFTLRLDPPT